MEESLRMSKKRPHYFVILGAILVLTFLSGSVEPGARPVYAAAATATLPSPNLQVNLVPVASQLQQPVFAGHAGDGSGRLFVVEKAGTIRILQDGALLPQPFLDISDRVNSASGERGLLGLAFPPDFAQTGYFFVNYTDADGNTNVARFSVAGNSSNAADAGSANIADPASAALDELAATEKRATFVFPSASV